MPSLFMGLETASRALSASQGVLDTIGHNLANVNTPGYSRQTVKLAATEPYSVPGMWHLVSPGQVGSGVQIESVNRVRDDFVQNRLYAADGSQGQYTEMQDALDRVQQAYSEPGQGGLSSTLTAFFNAFQELSRTPENSAARTLVRQQGETLASQFHTVYNNLAQIDLDLKSRVQSTVDEANRLAQNLADLNVEIKNSLTMGDHPNDLMDKRDEMIRQMATLVGAQATPEMDVNGHETGNVNVSVGGFMLVQGSAANKLPGQAQIASGSAQLVGGDDVVTLRGGQAAGFILASQITEGYQADLNSIAAQLVQRVNAQHQQGYGLDGLTGRDFFKGADATNMAVSDAIEADVSSIGAATAPVNGQPVAPGNGENARAIADISTQGLFGNFTISDYYSAHVARVGADARTYEQRASNGKTVITQLESMRSSISGVSIDEEMTRMLQFQRSYQAAARIVTTMDSLLDTIINGMGAGR